jgi:hypothetical protein
MKTLSTYSIAILATYIMSSVANADTGTAATDQTTPKQEQSAATTPAQPAALDAATTTAVKPKTQAEKDGEELRKQVSAIREKNKANPEATPASDKKLLAFVNEHANKITHKAPYNDVKFQKDLSDRLDLHKRERKVELMEAAAKAAKEKADSDKIAADRAESERLAAEKLEAERVAAANNLKGSAYTLPNSSADTTGDGGVQAHSQAELERLEAAYKKCTADCAEVRNEAARLRAENDQIRKQLDDANRGRKSTYDRDADDPDAVYDRNGRRIGTRNGRNTGHTPAQVLGGLFGNGNNGNISPWANDPFSLNNPNLFGQNGMQNPYPNWLQQQQLAQMMMQNQNVNPYGLNQGRQLPNMYPAPGGGIQQQPYGQQPWPGMRPGGPMIAGPAFGGGAPYPYAGAPFSGGYGMGGAPMIAGPAYGGPGYGVGGGYPVAGGYRPPGVGVGGIGGGYQIGGGYGAGYRGNAPAVLPIGGGVAGAYGGGYGLGANVGGWNTPVYNGGYQQYAQYNTRQLPSVYPAPY